MSAAADHPIGTWIGDLAGREPTPGGGGAAAIAAATGSALGAMAARYTTGRKWADRAETVGPLLALLDTHIAALLVAADLDAAAYAELQASWKRDDLEDAQRAAIADRARAVPADIVARCADACEALAAFLPRCNPMIVSDGKAAIHLLAGAARAAWQTLTVNEPTAAQADRARADLDRCAAAERPLLGVSR